MTANHEHTPTWDRVREHYYLGRQQFDDPLFPAGGVTEIVAEFDRWLASIEAAAEQRGAEAALLCVDEPSWEHHDQTDGFPCTNCLNKAQKSIDRYRADQMEGDDADA